MFSAPQRIQTQVFASLPDPLRLSGRPSGWAARQPNIGPIHSLLEGPCISRDGAFYCVDVAHGRIFEISGEEFRVLAEYDGEPNGMRAHKDGRIFVADYKNGLMQLDPDSGRITPVVEHYGGDRFLGVNDLTFADNGDLYFTDQGLTGLQDASGRVYRRTADGEVNVLLDNIPSPNGLVLNREQTELYLAVTRENAIWRIPLQDDGGTSKVGRFIQLSGGIGPDGLAIDSAGNLLVAHVGLGCVWVFNPQGEPVLRIDSCAGRMTTNLTFGGADRRTLFITEAENGVILKVALATAGQPLYSHR